MIVLAGGDLVLPDRILPAASLLLDNETIAAVDARPSIEPAGAQVLDVAGRYVVPGFIDVHVHGVDGFDTLDGEAAVASIARRLPRYGVTAFCPTSVACPPAELEQLLEQVTYARDHHVTGLARVLPAHLESNFISPEYRGAQPAGCLRLARLDASDSAGPFSATEILDVIASATASVGIVTLAPELPGGIDLVRRLVAAGHRVSLGHSGADYDTTMTAIEAGARHATHLFNRMTPISHRAPGIAGAVLASDAVTAEVICDGYHVHPAMVRLALAAKGAGGVVAITDGTAGSGLPVGATAHLGGRRIHVRERAAELDDGTLAGSTLTMNRAFRNVTRLFGGSIVDAARVCATTPAAALGLNGLGAIVEGGIGDLVVLDRDFNVVHTLIAGEVVFSATTRQP